MDGNNTGPPNYGNHDYMLMIWASFAYFMHMIDAFIPNVTT